MQSRASDYTVCGGGEGGEESLTSSAGLHGPPILWSWGQGRLGIFDLRCDRWEHKWSWDSRPPTLLRPAVQRDLGPVTPSAWTRGTRAPGPHRAGLFGRYPLGRLLLGRQMGKSWALILHRGEADPSSPPVLGSRGRAICPPPAGLDMTPNKRWFGSALW